MAFSVQMAADSYQVEPGSSVSVAVEVKNLGESKEQYELSLEGLDHHWAAVPVPSFHVEAGETRVERIFLKPPRDSESSAGMYPFVIKVRSLDTGDTETAQGDLEINPYYHLSLDVNPRRAAVSPINRQTEGTITVMNLGNVDQTVQLFANDTEDAFAYEFAEDQVTLASGQQRDIAFSATSTKSGAFSPARLHVVTVSCRNVENPAFAGSAQMHIEQKPLLAPGAIAALAMVLLVALAWILTLPKPPKVLTLTLDKPEVMVGDSVQVQWKSEGANSVSLMYGDTVVADLPPTGTYTITPIADGQVDVSVQAITNNLKSAVSTKSFSVKAKEVAADPEIQSFTVDRSEVPLGQSFTLSYQLNSSSTWAYLDPYGKVEIDGRNLTITAPMSKGSETYTLRVRNADGKEVKKSLTVRFVQVVDAKIVRLEANPAEVEPLDGRVTLVWQLANAVSATLKYGDQTVELDAMGGRRDFTITEDTTFVITAFDANGLKAEKSVKVKVKRPPEPETTGNTTGGDPGSTTGITTTPPPTTRTTSGGTR